MRNLLRSISKFILDSGVFSTIKSFILIYFDSFLYLINFSINSKENYDVALVRLDHVGDFFLWMDSAKELVEYYQNKNILLITSNVNKDYAESLGYWNHVVGIDARLFSTNILYRAKIIFRLRRIKTNAVIHPVVSRKFYCGDSIVRALRAERKVGSKSDLTNMLLNQKRVSDTWYTELVDNSVYAVHELEKNAFFLKSIGVGDGTLRVADLPVQALPEKLDILRPYCVVFPGASWFGRQWSAKSFSEVANFLFEKYGLTIVLCGSGNEWDLCEQVRVSVNSHESFNFAGLTRIQDLVEIVRRSNLLISNETSAVHIAAALGKKSICIAGGGHWQRFVPYPSIIPVYKRPLVVNVMMDCYGCNWTCIHNVKQGDSVPCVKEVSINQVITAISNLLDSD